MRDLQRGSAYAMLLLLPLTIFRPLGVPTVPGILPHFSMVGVEVLDLPVLLLLLVTGALRWQGRHERHAPPGQWRTALPLLALALLALLTSPFAIVPDLATVQALRWFLAAGVYIALVDSGLSRVRMIELFLLGLTLQVAVGVGQVLVQAPLGLPGEVALPIGVPGAAVLQIGDTPWLRAYGLTFHPNVLGGFLAVGLLVSVPLLERRWMRPLWWWLMLGLLLTFSRAAWIALALTLPPLVLWLALKHPSLRRSLALTLGVAAGVGLLFSVALAPQLISRLRPSTLLEARSIGERGDLLIIASIFIRAHPLTGVGAGNFSAAMVTGALPGVPQPVHNVPILLAAETGLLGGALWLWLWFAPFFLDLPPRSLWLPALLAAWLALCLIALWDMYPWVLSSGRLLLMVVLAWMHD